MTDYRTFAENLARQAGAIMRKGFVSGMKKEWKKDHSPVTETDTTINQLVLDAISKEYPSHSILAEEGSMMQEQSEYVWVCDPLDGTAAFSHRIPTCVFALALVRDGDGLLGLIYDPFLDRMVIAEKGKGAFLNGEQIHVSSFSSIEHAGFGVSYGHIDRDFDMLPLTIQLRNQHARVFNVGAIMYEDMLVATGDLAGSLFHGQKPHDTAASAVIVQEAGGKVTDLFGERMRLDKPMKGHICSNGILHDELVAMAKKFVKES